VQLSEYSIRLRQAIAVASVMGHCMRGAAELPNSPRRIESSYYLSGLQACANSGHFISAEGIHD
jgi:hypothetical protein